MGCRLDIKKVECFIRQLDLLQQVIDYIDEHIKDDIQTEKLASIAGYSSFHFSRLFQQTTGYTLMDYVQKRKLQFALHELLEGKKILHIALDYGFETHAGFTKAFKKCFGSPPSLYRLHCPSGLPPRLNLLRLEKQKTGGVVMQPKIIHLDAFKIAGKKFESHIEKVAYTRDAPAFWNDRIPEEEAIETTLYQLLSPKKHGEFCLNLNGDKLTDSFQYFFAVHYDDGNPIPYGISKMTVPAGAYAVFRTPLVKVDQFVDSIRGTWSYILNDWLPFSSYEVDEERYDFEYYDEHCHDWIYEKIYMEIFLPIKVESR